MDRPKDKYDLTIDRLLDALGQEESGVRLVPDELLLIDWVLSAASRILPGADDLGEYIKWERLRRGVWALLAQGASYLQDDDHSYFGLVPEMTKLGRYLEMDRTEARSLLAIAPTTFRWGTAPDCAFSLKVKLSQYIAEVYRDPQRDQDQARAQDSAQGETGDQPAT